jgi:transcriptional regulator with XRE-family HTH domain
MNIKREIIRIRKNNRLSQEAFAETIGVSRQSVTKWENGDSVPEIENLLIISNIFKITLDSLIKGPTAYSVSPEVKEQDENQIIEFLCTAKKSTYAGSGQNTASSRLYSHDLKFQSGPMEYLDSYFGGEQFIGEEVLWLSDKPIWSMNYMGRVLKNTFSGDFLKESLLAVTHDLPYRGPELYIKGDYIYHNKVMGSFFWFSGEEEIYYRNEKVYECLFHGGKIR